MAKEEEKLYSYFGECIQINYGEQPLPEKWIYIMDEDTRSTLNVSPGT